MKIPEKIGMYSVFIITPILVSIPFYCFEYKEIAMLFVAIGPTFFIPWIYDRIRQHRQRNNIIEFVDKRLEHIERLEGLNHIEKIVETYINELYYIESYVQDAYSAQIYTTYMTKIKYLKEDKKNKEYNRYYKLVLQQISEIRKMLVGE